MSCCFVEINQKNVFVFRIGYIKVLLNRKRDSAGEFAKKPIITTEYGGTMEGQKRG
jgi:hypothetical protein